MNQSSKESWISWAVWIVTLLVIVPAFFVFRSYSELENEVSGELEKTTTKLAMLERSIAARNREEQQNQLNRRIVFDFLSQCRKVTDIPHLPGGQIYAATRNTSPIRLNFYVPKGNHTLNIDIAWGDTLDVNEPKQRTIPLIGDAGYSIEIEAQSSDKSKPLTWKLESNNPTFEPLIEKLPVDEEFIAGAWSRHVDSVARFPNETAIQIETPEVKLLRYSITGLLGDQEYKVTITASLLSECDDVVRASEATTFDLNKGKLRPYEGGGYFLVDELPEL